MLNVPKGVFLHWPELMVRNGEVSFEYHYTWGVGLLFGAAADYVVEIITNHPITPIPLVPSYVCGIINLRGQIIPIVDIRIMLGQMPTNRDCIIILTINGMLVGVLVDTVLRMIDLDTATLCMSPAKEHQRLVSGMCSLPDGETMLEFDCANLLTQA